MQLFTNVLNFTSTLPVLVMDTFGKYMRIASQDQFVHLSLYEPVNGKPPSHMKDWLSNRVDFIDRQLTQPPTLNRAGGHIPLGFALVLTAQTPATVYYTLDGSDPRLPEGTISSNAIVYAGAIPLKANARLVARSYDINKRQIGGPPTSTPWSSAVTANFVVTPP